MGQRISGTGVGLQLPQFLYPSEINPAQVPPDLGNNRQTLAPGTALPVPEGSWYIDKGNYCVLQYLDPINGVWRGLSPVLGHNQYVISDGFNYRIANLTGCPVAAVVSNGGSAYVQETTTVTASGTGGSTWQAIVGGALSVTSIVSAGGGFSLPPLLFIQAPPSPGVQATGHCTLVAGTVSAVTLDNVGAGYPSAPLAVIVPNPSDPNLSNNTAITQASVTLAVVASGSITAVLCTNPGASIAAAPTLTVAGAGSGATVAAVWMSTLVSATVASTGVWTGGAALTSVGGGNGTTSWIVNPSISEQGFISRPIQALLSGGSNSLTSVSALYDGGLFLATPNLVVSPITNGSLATVTITATYGGVVDTVLLQPAP